MREELHSVGGRRHHHYKDGPEREAIGQSFILKHLTETALLINTCFNF
jgi:hypothetical protein